MTGGGRWQPPSSDAPASPQEPVEASIVSEDVTGTRHTSTVTGRDSRELEYNIILKIAELRAAARRIVKTEMTLGPDVWTYEYNTTGDIERVFRNGDVTP